MNGARGEKSDRFNLYVTFLFPEHTSTKYTKFKQHKSQAYGIPLKTTGSQSLVGDRKAGSSLLLHCRGWALQVTADYMSEKCGLGEGTCGGERLEPGGGYMGDWNC